ncbi:MAG: response regulator transcription factor [Bacteroidota bacterium]
MIKVIIAEDHQAFIDGIQSYLQFEKDIKVIASANDGEELLKMVDRWKPHIVLCDIRMPKLDGIGATKAIKNKFSETRVIAFTMFDSPKAMKRMIDAGVSGYITKNSPMEIVLEGIRTVASGQSYFSDEIEGVKLVGQDTKEKLSSREKEILALVANGFTSREIAEKLFIGKQTVDTHRKNMVKKLGLSGNGELMRYALERKYDYE